MGYQRNRAAAVRADLQHKIDKAGWAVVGVFPTQEAPGTPFAYTVGLSAKNLPELALYGVDVQIAAAILNDVARRMVDAGSAVQHGEHLHVGRAGGLQLVAIEMTDVADLTSVCSLYGTVKAALQLVLPDEAGQMPWQEGYAVPAECQPLHGLAPTGP